MTFKRGLDPKRAMRIGSLHEQNLEDCKEIDGITLKEWVHLKTLGSEGDELYEKALRDAIKGRKEKIYGFGSIIKDPDHNRFASILKDIGHNF